MIMIKRLDGGVSLMTLLMDCDIGNEIDKWSQCHPDQYVGHVGVEPESLPPGDFFRDAWEHDGDAVKINFEKARTITKVRLRTERIPFFAYQDLLFQRAQETGASVVSIVAEKNRLRDITKLADAATTLDALKAIML